MIIKLLKILGSFFLVLCIIFFIIAIWGVGKIVNHSETTLPVVEAFVPELVSWNHNGVIKFMPPNLTPETNKEIEVALAELSRYGKIIHTEKPLFSKASTSAGTHTKGVPLTYYLVEAEFETGKYSITIEVAEMNNEYYIKSFWFTPINKTPNA